MQSLSQILPTIAGPVDSVPHYDQVLTPEMKEAAIKFAIDQLKNSSKGKMKQLSSTGPIDWEAYLNIEEVLQGAARRAWWAIVDRQEAEARKAAEAEKFEQMKKQFTVVRFYGLIKNWFIMQNGSFVEDNLRAVKAICYFFARDPRFETDLGYDFTKGLMIEGDTGTGKTSTIRAIAENPVYPVDIYNMIDIANQVRERGSVDLNTRRNLMLDDVGSEPEVINHFGTKIVWFKEFIESYYMNNTSFDRLIITMNCTSEDIEQRYTARVRSRMREMFNQIIFTGHDKRK